MLVLGHAFLPSLSSAPFLGQSSPYLPICVQLGLSHSLSLVTLTVASGSREELEGKADRSLLAVGIMEVFKRGEA